jgi:Skp family chaperone for outer membrane proteins
MKIKVLDFEQVAVCYKPYVDAVSELETKGSKLREELQAMQTEAQAVQNEAMTLMNPEDGTEISEVDNATITANQQKFQTLQQDAMLKDKNFKQEADEEQRRIVMMSYDGISALVAKYTEANSDVDTVLNRSEVVYFKPENDLTQTIIEMIKESNLYTEARLQDHV